MAFRMTCRCGAKLPVGDELLGKKVKCPKCGAVLQVPEKAPAATPVVPPPSAPPEQAPATPSSGAGGMPEGPLGFSGPGQSTAPKAGGEPSGPRHCTVHPDTPSSEQCPQCQRPFCKACLVPVEAIGLLCPDCHRTLVMARAKALQQKRQQALLRKGLPIAAAALAVLGVLMWWLTRMPATVSSIGPQENVSAPPILPGGPAPVGPTVTISSTTVPVQVVVEDAPDAPPPVVPVATVDPAPENLPPQVATPSQKVVSRLLKEAGKVHQEIFENLDTTIQGLKDRYQRVSTESRIEVVRDLMALNHRKCLVPLQLALEDPDEKVREMAAVQLGRFASSRSVKPLNDILLGDKAETTRAAAADALARCGDESAFPALIKALRDPSVQVRQKAYDALRRLSGQFILFDTSKPPGEQAEAIQKWEQWFEENRNKVIRGDWYRMRTPIGQRIAMIRFGGAGTERAVAAALDWFTRAQYPEGCWDHKPYPEAQKESEGKPITLSGNALGLTGLVTLSFMASGHTPEVGEHQAIVAKAVEWIMKSQQKNGQFGTAALYAHGICTMAICEAYGMTGQDRYKEVAMKAIDYIVKTQGQIGGFTYTGPGFDTSVSGWMFMGLIAGMEAGLDVPEEALRKAQYYLRFMLRPNGSTAYNVGVGKDGSVALSGGSYATTAIGIICRQFFAYPPDDKEIKLSMEYLGKWAPDAKALYSLYYTTLVMFQMGGKEWGEWNKKFKDLLIQRQDNSGPEKGSWPPDGVDYAGHTGGRTYSTVMSTLCLQVYYRYPPIYK